MSYETKLKKSLKPQQRRYMSRLNDADFVVDEIMQIFDKFNDKSFANRLPAELIESPEFNGLSGRLSPLNEEMKTNYGRFHQDEGKVIVQAFDYVRFHESFRDSPNCNSYNFEAPRFNEGASLL